MKRSGLMFLTALMALSLASCGSGGMGDNGGGARSDGDGGAYNENGVYRDSDSLIEDAGDALRDGMDTARDAMDNNRGDDETAARAREALRGTGDPADSANNGNNK